MECRGERVIVLDSSAFIAGTDNLYSLSGLVDSKGNVIDARVNDTNVVFYTTPDVINEVKDPAARKRLKLVESVLKVRVPSKEAVSSISEFARISGDFASLSITDLRVLGLAWMLEFERNGSKFMKKTEEVRDFRKPRGIPAHVLDAREEALRVKAEEEKEKAENSGSDGEWATVTSKPRPVPMRIQRRMKNEAKKRRKQQRNLDLAMDECATANLDGNKGAKATLENASVARNKASQSFESIEDSVAHMSLESSLHAISTEGSTNEKQTDVVVKNISRDVSFAANGSSYTIEDLNRLGSDDDDDWITTENVDEHMAQDGGDTCDDSIEDNRVGCVTTDFAMQNVLLQTGMKVISTDGRRVVRQVKRFVLRCHACYAIEMDVSRKFCGKCGNASLHKVAFKVNKQGVARVFVNPRYKPSLRGTKYSIPLPKGGRNNKDLVLREDQIDPVKLRRLQKQRARWNVDVLDPTSFYNAGAKFALLHDQTQFGYGRRNPNENRPGKNR